MSKEKTAMQQIRQRLIDTIDFLSDANTSNAEDQRIKAYNTVIDEIDKVYLSVEQEQIEIAFDSGYSDGLGAGTGTGELKYNDVSYYQSKYGGDK